MIARESSERKSLLIRVIMVIITILLSFLATILYVTLYPKTTIVLYDMDGRPLLTKEVKKYSRLDMIPTPEKQGYTFLYWSYNDYGGEKLDPSVEVSSDVVRLYANYQVNSYTVTYNILAYNESTGREEYFSDQEYCKTRVFDYGTSFILPTGKNQYGELIDMLEAKPGFHFAGWTTKVVEEDDPQIDKYLRAPGSEFALDIASDINFYAYWEKNQYTVNMHTGIKYEYEGGNVNTPKKDADGKYIIKNLEPQELNENEGLIKGKITYLDTVTSFVGDYSDIKLTEKNAGPAYGEYDFKGWYLDEDYTISSNGTNIQVLIDKNDKTEHPYIIYKDKDGVTQRIYSKQTGVDLDGKPIYEFDLYSKWERRSYEISFASTYGLLDSIHLYRVLTQDDGSLYDYENYYAYTYGEDQDTIYFGKVNLEKFIPQQFKDAGKDKYTGKEKYRLIGWEISDAPTDEITRYAAWRQKPWSEDLASDRTTGSVYYDNPIYTHFDATSITLVAQWAKVYSILFNSGSKYVGATFAITGIEGEWFFLPDMDDVSEKGWKNSYHQLSGWKEGDSELSTKYDDKLDGITPNPKYYFIIDNIKTSNLSKSLYAIWDKMPYSATFYYNDGTENYKEVALNGDDSKSFPEAPKREGYVFDGWSKYKYSDNEYAIAIKNDATITEENRIYSTSNSYSSNGKNPVYYASWSIDYTIEYDFNNGELTTNTPIKTTFSYNDYINEVTNNGKYSMSKSQYLSINLAVGRNIYISRGENYTFGGWKVRINNDELSDFVIKEVGNSGQSSTGKGITTVFDFYENTYYNNIADKQDLHLQAGNKVVLVAVWIPAKYNITIYYTLPNLVKSRVDSVSFDEDYTFPIVDDNNVRYDSKAGYMFLGFSLDPNSKVPDYKYDLENPDNMPVILAGTLQSSKTFYAIYQEKKINVIYKYKIAGASDDDWAVYTPPTSLNCTSGEAGYNSKLKLPKNPILSGIDSNSKFVGWYYINTKGERIDLTQGVEYLVSLSENETDKMIIYADLVIEKYEITFKFTNPYDNKVIETVAKVVTVNKDTFIDDTLYQTFIDLVNENIVKNLNDYRVNQSSYDLRGFTLDGLLEVSVYGDPKKFEIGSQINPTTFTTLKNNNRVLTIQTKWNADNITIVYRSNENPNEQTRQNTIKYNEEALQLESANIFTLDSGKVIDSWYLLDSMTNNKEYFQCGAKLFSSSSSYKSLHSLYQYITWDQDGNGTLNIYANIQQNCTINFYNYHQLTTTEKVREEPFYLGNQTNDMLNYSQSLGNLKFLGWYCYDASTNTLKKVTELSDSMFNVDNGFAIDLYANYSIDIEYYMVKIEGRAQSKVLSKTVTYTTLEYTPANGYSYVREFIIAESDVPAKEVVENNIPSNYTYHGVKLGDDIHYSLNNISTDNAKLSLSTVASNATQGSLSFETYYTIEYQVVYSVSGGVVVNGGTKNIVEPYDVEHAGNYGKTVKINYEATLAGKVFKGWQISPNIGESAKVYKLNDTFDLLEAKTILVPYFVDPEKGTINVKITLIDGNNRYQSKTIEKKNGDEYTFLNNTDLSWIDNAQVLSYWIDENGRMHEVGSIYTIPVNAVEGEEYKFTGIWTDMYTIRFTQSDNYQNASKIDSINIKKGDTLTIGENYIPTINNDDVTFNGWMVQDLFDSNGDPVTICKGDKIVIGKYLEYNYSQDVNSDAIIHYIPAPSANGYRGYVLVGDWDSKEYTITLVITDPANSTIDKTTIVKTTNYGTTYSDRELIKDNAIVQGLESSGQHAIVGWATNRGATSIDENSLKNITEHKTLYSVWKTKVTITFDENSEIGYLDAQNNIVNSLTIADQVPGDMLDTNKLVKSIYVKGYTTVYFEDGTFRVYSAGSNDYYQVVKFVIQGSTTRTLIIKQDNSFDSIQIQSSNMTITPIVERVHKVSFYDNTNASGGYEYSSIPASYVRSTTSPNNVVTLAHDANIIRTGYNFLGWNISKDADDRDESDTCTVTSNTKIYAIWESTRVVNFVATFVTDYSTTTSTVIAGIKLNKDNKIKIDTLRDCLENPSNSSNCIGLEKLTNSVLAKHPAYKHSSKNLYLDGFIVTDANDNTRTLNIEELANFDFGSSNNDVNVRLNFKEIYVIEYSTGNKDDVVGTINAPDYIVALESTIGKLKADGSIGTMRLPEPGVTRENYDIYGWSTINIDNRTNFNSTTDYDINNNEQMTLDSNELTAIINELINQRKTIYTLYAVWQYKLIDIYVYTLANLNPDGNGLDTTLVDHPYDVYKNYTNETKENIPFKNTANFIYQSGNPVYYVRNYYFNTQDANQKKAQLKFNSSFKLITPDRVSVRNQFTTKVGGYELIGWSVILYPLGSPVENTTIGYFEIGSEININKDVVINGKLELYPVYRVISEKVNIQTLNGDVEYTINSSVSGYVYNPNQGASSTVRVSANSTKTIELDRYQSVDITRKDPMNDVYLFDSFEFSYKADKITATSCTILGTEFIGASEHDHDYYVYAVFSSKQLALNININYACELKAGLEETTQFKFYSKAEYPPVELATVTKTNSTKVVNVNLDQELTFVIENNSNYYNYNLMSGSEAIVLINGNTIKLSDLKISANVNAQGYYEAQITIEATPKMIDIEFRLLKGTINSNYIAVTQGDVYAGYTQFDLVNGNAGSVVAKVAYGSTITLPTEGDMSYANGGAFNGFYVYGDEDDKTIVTSYKITGKVIFVELYNVNTYMVTYSYEDNNGGRTIQITGIAHNSRYVIGQDKLGSSLSLVHKDGYEFKGWHDTISGADISDGTVIEKLTQNYRLHAKYEAKKVTIKYVYGDNLSEVVYVPYDEAITTLQESDLSGVTASANKYIAGWTYNGKFVVAGDEITFDALGFSYEDNAEIEFTAKYYSKYKYSIEYVTTGVNNASVFTTDTHYVITTSEDGQSIDSNTLKYTIKSVEPINVDQEMHFTHYTVRYSTNGGASYVTYVAGNNELLLPGYQIALVEPTDINTTIIYEFTPQFANNAGVLDVTYVITNPSYDSNNPSDKPVFVENTYKFNTGFALEDGYLPSISGYAIDSNSNTQWSIISKGVTFDIEHSTMDFRKFTLVGYTLEITKANGDVITRNLTLGQSSNDRDVSGATAIKLTSRWAENSLVKYFDLDGTEIIELREYVNNDVTTIALKSLTSFNAIQNNTYNVSRANHTWIGWTTKLDPINKNNSSQYYAFENGRVNKGDYNFYPALSQHYAIQVITAGVDSADLSGFVLKETNTLQPSYVYVGMNTTTIDLSNYTDINVYSKYDSSKYLFRGYSMTEDGEVGYTCQFDINNLTNDGKINVYAIWQKSSYRVNVEFEALDNNGVNKASEYSLKDQNALVKLHGVDLTLYSFDGNDYTFNDKIGDIVSDILSQYKYFTFQDIVIIYSANNVSSELYSYTANESTTITVRFAPVYGITYYLYDYAELEGYDPDNIQYVEAGQPLTPRYDYSQIEFDGYTILYWGYRDYEIVNGQQVFTEEKFFDNNNRITSFDPSNYTFTEDYILTLYPIYNWEYTVNLYYIESVDKLNEYKNLLTNNPNPTEEQKQNVYTKLTSLEMYVWDSLIKEDSNHNIVNVFDEKIAEKNLTINGNAVTKFSDLFNVFETQQYTSNGFVTVNSGSVEYDTTYSGVFEKESYYVKTYNPTNYSTNNIYIVYSPIEYSLLLGTLVVNDDLSYSQALANQHSTYSEFALTQEQIDDNGGDDVELDDQRLIGWPINLYDIVASGQEYYTYGLGAITYFDSIYLFNADRYKRVENKGYEFQKWMIAEYSLNGNNIDVTFKDLDEFVNVVESNGMITISGVKENITLVALYSIKTVTVNITVQTTNGLGHQLDVSIKGASNSGDTYTAIAHTMTPDTTNKVATTSIEVQLGSWLEIRGSTNNPFVVDSINDGIHTYLISSLTFEITNALIGQDDCISIVVIYKPITYNVYVSTIYSNIDDIKGTIDSAYYYVGNEKLNTNSISSILETYHNHNFNYKIEVVGHSLVKQDLATPTLTNYTFEGWEYYNTSTSLFEAIPDTGIEITGNTYLKAIFTPKSVTVRYYMDVTEDPKSNTKTYERILGLDTQYTTAQVGQRITLPYVVIDLNDRISSGWTCVESGTTYKFGDQVAIVTTNNAEFITDGSGNLFFDFYATIIEKHYVYYSQGESSFKVNESEYPKEANDSSVVYEDSFAFESAYYYVKFNSIPEDSIELNTSHLKASAQFAISQELIIPTYSLESTNGVSFVGWMTTTNPSQIYQMGDKYEYFWADDTDNNHIVLQAIPSNYVELQFYITDPSCIVNIADSNAERVILNLTDRTTVDPSLPYLSIFIDKGQVNSNQILSMTGINHNENFVVWQFNDSPDAKTYFTTNILDGKTIANNYRFYGWSINDSYDSFQDITDTQGKSNIVSILDDTYSKDKNACATKLTDLLEESTSSPIRLYTVWENKYEVKFTFNGKTYSNEMYAKNDKIVAPKPTDEDTQDIVYINNGQYKWLGWVLKNPGTSDNMIFEDSAVIDNAYYFENGKYSWYYEGGANQEFITVWRKGYKITLDMNFDTQRENVANVITGYSQGNVNVSDIGYPYYIGNNSLVSSISNKEYAYGDIWTKNDTLDLSTLTNFVDIDIYPKDVTLSLATWLSSYYTFQGWSLAYNGNCLTPSELSDIAKLRDKKSITGDIVLYAQWSAIELTINMFQTKELAQTAHTNGTMSNIKLHVTFGSTEYMDYLRKVALGTVPDNDPNKTDAFIKSHQRFNRWVPVALGSTTIDTDSEFNDGEKILSIVNNLYLYPVYDEEFTVKFYSVYQDQNDNIKIGNELVDFSDPDNRQKVIEGQNISVIEYLIDTLNQNKAYIGDLYYYNAEVSDNKVLLWSRNDGKIVFTESLLFEKSKFAIVNDHYINIYVKINANVKLNVTPVGEVDTEYKTFNIPVQEDQLVFDGCTFVGEYNLDTSIYGENTPILEGWYFSKIDAEDAFDANKNYRVNSFKIVSKSNGYYIVIRNDSSDPIEIILDNLDINFYAKLVIEVTVELGEDDDQSIVEFAKLSSVGLPANYPSHVQSLINTTLTSKIVKINNVDYIKSFSYKTLFGDNYHPTFMIETNSYNIVSISGLFTIDELKDQLTSINSVVINSDQSSASASLTKAVVEDSLQTTYTLEFDAVNKNNQVFRIAIAIHQVTVQFTYDTDEGSILYKTKESDERFIPFDTEGSHFTEVERMYDSSIDGYIATSIELNYKVTPSEEDNSIQTVTYTNVPYGAKIYVNPVSVQSMVTHFVGWNAKWSDVDDTAPSAIVPSIDKNYSMGYIKFSPNERVNEDEKLMTEYIIEANFEANVIESFNLILDFDAGSLVLDDGSLNPWGELLSNYQGEKQEVRDNSTNALIKYTIPITLDCSIGTVYAGEDVTHVLSTFNSAYHYAYDNLKVTSPIDSLNLVKLLRYFWFDDNENGLGWMTNKGKDDLNNKPADGILTEAILADGAPAGYYVLYALDGSTVTLRKNMTPAIVLDINDRTIDYTTLEDVNGYSIISGVDRANVAFAEDGYNEAFSLDPVTHSSGSILLKTKYIPESIVKLTATPASATSEHSAYVVHNWVFDADDVNNGGNQGSGVITPNGDHTTIIVKFTNEMYRYFLNIDEVTMPELRLRADVVAQTHRVNFKNSDGFDIKSIEVAYDRAIADLGYSYYLYTLENLYNEESKHTMPRFVLMDSEQINGIQYFSHPEDQTLRSADSYGEYKYIFKGWASSTTATSTLGIDDVGVINSFVSGSYSEVNLYAYYREATQVQVMIFKGDECTETTQSLYLIKDYTDDFGVTYTNEVLNQTSVKEFIATVDPEASDNDKIYDFYAKDSEGKYVLVATLSELEQLGTNIIYPAIIMKVNITNSADPVTVTTIGGKLTLSMSSYGQLIVGNIVAELNGNEVINENMNLSYVTDPVSSFAYWDTDNGFIKDFVTTYAFSKSATYYDNQLDVIPVYNPNFTVSSVGDVKITDSTGNRTFSTNSILKVYDKTPTCVDLDEDREIRLVYESITPGARTIALLQMVDVTTNTVLYKIQFSTDVIDAKIRWNITQGGNNTSIDETGKLFRIANDGFVTITPLVVPGEVTVTIEDFVISNLEGEYTDAYTYSKTSRSIKIEGGSTFHIAHKYDDEINPKYVTRSAINLVDINNEEAKDKLVATANNAYMGLFIDGVLYNFRWEYMTDSGSWVNLDGKYADTKNMTIRFVADWKQVEITFAKAKAIPNKVNTNDINGYNLVADGSNLSPLKYDNYKIKVDGVDVDGTTLYMLQGESLNYNTLTHSFELVTNINGRTNRQISIDFDSTIACLQGWLQYIPDTELNIISETTYNSMTKITYYAWVEGKVELKLDMVKTATGVVAGYGIVKYTVTNPYGTTDATATVDIVNKNYGSIVCGISSQVSITWEEDPNLGHKFENITYTALDAGNNSKTFTYIEDVNKTPLTKYAYNFYNKTLSILFDASSSEKTLYLTYTDLSLASIPNEYKIYGGYQLNFEKVDDTIVLTAKNYFNADVSGLNGLIIYMQGGNNNSSGNLYPRSGYSLDTLKMYSTNTLTYGSSIQIEDYTTQTIYQDEIKVSDYPINPSSDRNEYLVLCLTEYVSTLTLKFKVQINQLPDEYDHSQTITQEYLSSTTAYLSDGENIVESASNNYSLDGKNNNNINIKCATAFNNKDSILLNIKNNQGDAISSQYIITNSKYQLVSASLNSSNTTLTDNKCEIGFTKEVNVSINYNEYTLLIEVNETKESKVAFKFTLLPEDLTNIDLCIEEGLAYSDIVKLETFNKDADEDGNIDIIEIAVEKDDKVAIEQSDGRTYLKFYRYQRDVANFVYLSISYNNQVSDYNIKGWWMDTSSNHLMLNTITKFITPDDSYGTATASNLEYLSYSYDNTTAITTTQIAVDEDCAFVLDLERKPVYIYVDDTANKYWPTNISNISNYSSENDFIKDAINDISSNGSLYIAPSGLISLSFPEDQSTNFIRKGNAILDLGGGDDIELEPYVGNYYSDESFAIVNNSNVEFNENLLGSEKWKLVNIPYGDTDEDNHIELHIHSYEHGHSLAWYKMTVVSVSSGNFNFITTNSDSSGVYFYIGKNILSRLNYGFFESMPSNDYYYNYEMMQFYNDIPSSSSYNRLLVGYDVYDNNGNHLRSVSGEINLSNIFPNEKYLHVYPIWEKRLCTYTITIDFDNGIMKYDSVVAGDSYTYDYYWSGLGQFLLNLNPNDTMYFITEEYSKYLPTNVTSSIFMGLETADVEGDYSMLTVSPTKLTQHFYEDKINNSDYGGGLIPEVDQAYKNIGINYAYGIYIKSVNCDIYFKAITSRIGREVTYDCLNVIAPMFSSMKSEYTAENITQQSASFPNMVDGMYHPVGTYIPMEWGEDAINYFVINAYYSSEYDYYNNNPLLNNYNSVNNIMTNAGEGDGKISDDRELYFTISHIAHKMISYASTCMMGYELNQIYGTNSFSPCNQYQYYGSECQYCTYTQSGGWVMTDYVIHDICEPPTRKYDDTYHWKSDICSRCGYEHYYEPVTLHNFDAYDYENQSYHYHRCSTCGKSKLEVHAETYSPYIYNDTAHQTTVTCVHCEGFIRNESGGHVMETYIYAAATCTSEGQINNACYYCSYSYVTTTPKSSSHSSVTTVTVSGTCTSDGYYLTYCTACDESISSAPMLDSKVSHTVAKWTTKNATCTTAGERKGKCTGCNQAIFETIPATGHNYNYSTTYPSHLVLVPGQGKITCGYKLQTCSCGATKESGHSCQAMLK